MAVLTRISALVIALTIPVFLAGVGVASALMLREPDRGPRDATWERVQVTREIVIGIDPSIPPFGEFSGDTVDGLDPSLGHAIAKELGVEVRFVPLGFDGLYDALLLGYVDLVIAALRPDNMRLDRIRYTSSYFDAGHVLVSQGNIQNLDELSGKIIAVEFASEGDLAARSVPDIQIERYFTAQEAMQAVRDGEANAALVDHVSAALYRDELSIAPGGVVPDPYVIATRRNDWRLHRYVEEALQTLRASGTLNALSQEWLVPVPGAVP
jgi:ABC-type amino acid transport substrate-binding protein